MLKTYKLQNMIRSLSLSLQSKQVSLKRTLTRDHCVFVSNFNGQFVPRRRPWYANERCPYDFVFTLGTMSIRLSEEERKDLAGVYTWLRLDMYVGLESVIKYFQKSSFCTVARSICCLYIAKKTL